MALPADRLTRPAESPRNGDPGGLTGLGLAAGVGLAVLPLAVVVSALPRRHLMIATLGVLVMAAAGVARRPRQVLFGGWIVALTYNRAFFAFAPLIGEHGSQGPYWVLSDILLVPLLLLWLYEIAVQKTRRVPLSPSFGLYLLPLILALVLSGVAAQRLDWVGFELLRFARVGLVLLYLRYNFDRSYLITAVIALGLAVLIQGALGALEVATGRSGVLSILGLGGDATVYPEQYRQESFYGWRRATGTMNHPPHLASLFLLAVPILLSTGLAARRREVRVFCLGTGLVGLVGLACTLSRGPWILMGMSLLAIVVGHAIIRISNPQRALGRLIVGFCIAGAAVVPFTGLIADRTTRDFSESVDLRLEGYATALGMWAEQPLTGVGLNNYRVQLLEREPEMAWAVESDAIATRQLKVRFTYGPLNLYLLLLAEVGVIGLVAFLFFMGGALARGIRATWMSAGPERALYLGAVVGVGALLGQQMIDNSIWVEPILLSLTLVIAMIGYGTRYRAAAEPVPDRATSRPRPAAVAGGA